MRITKLLITGGPCSGKTTIKPFLKKELENRGFAVIFVPEVATDIILAGPHPETLPKPEMLEWQNLALKTQLIYEDKIYRELAELTARLKNADQVVMICDRGTLDGAVYISKDMFGALLKRNDLNWVSGRDLRYEAIFHLVTAADGAEKFYNKDNPARTETLDEAKMYDGLTKETYLGHPHQRIIDNSSDFEGKRRRLLAKVLRALGVPQKLEIERKFLLRQFPDFKKFPVTVQPIKITQHYIGEHGRIRIRCRAQDGEGIACYRTEKINTDRPDISIELENLISNEEYMGHFRELNSRFDAISKTRHYFIWKNQVFELDIFHEPDRLQGLALLEIELDDESDKVELPDWLGPLVEVTGDKKFKNRQMAKRPQ